MSNDVATPASAEGSVRNSIVCPDGTQFVVHEDGTWEQYAWDGRFVTDHTKASTTPADVLATIQPGDGVQFADRA